MSLAGLRLRNPVMLAAGTAGYGREVSGVIDLDALGGLVTKAVSVMPRPGAAAPRVAEFRGGMINAIGLANPGLEAVASDALPWLAANTRARVLVNVVGNHVDDFKEVVSRLDAVAGKDGFELNVSCPNVKAGGMEFGADPGALTAVVGGAREVTSLPIFVKLSPTLADIVESARIALGAGADGISLTNTLPGLVVDVVRRRPAVGFGTGGVSGAALRPVAVLATWKVFQATGAPIIGVGGISTADDALQFMLAGARAVAIGTAALRDPRAPERIVRDLDRWANRRGVRSLEEIVGALEWPS
ncbi:MAG: Dihydroorotate dehydrogenase B (NAD(+)), catalytic subunit [Gemmatimonadaceae bacterium]|nr:Dihydroorotate dehydrogenase B (NAD(+)), catalytic subunit [Gemmatimonadaceae bacterium]